MRFGLCRGQPAKGRNKGAGFVRVLGDCIEDVLNAVCYSAFERQHCWGKVELGCLAAETFPTHLPPGITRYAQSVDVGIYPFVEFHQVIERKMRRTDGTGSEMPEECRFFSKLGDYSLSNQRSLHS